MRNLWQHDTYIDKSILIGSYRYTWDKWQNYFMNDRLRRFLPCHYFAELLNKDYVVYVGLPKIKRSYFLEDLANANIIPFDCKDYILVCVGEDFNLDTVDTRLLQHLCDKLLGNLVREDAIQKNRIYKFDDLLKKNWKEKLSDAKLKYDITPMKHFNMDKFLFILNDYLKG
jgi:hypothetical protein